MIDLISKIEDYLNISIDYKKYLLIGNAFDKKALFLYKRKDNHPSILVRIPINIRAEKLCENEYNNLLYLNTVRRQSKLD